MRNFLDIGDGGGVLIKDIVCVIDADNSTKSKITRDFINKNKNTSTPKKFLSRVNSFVITDTFGKARIYSSPYSVGLIKKRANE